MTAYLFVVHTLAVLILALGAAVIADTCHSTVLRAIGQCYAIREVRHHDLLVILSMGKGAALISMEWLRDRKNLLEPNRNFLSEHGTRKAVMVL